MSDCCNDKACDIELLRERQSNLLKIVLGVNLVMFLVEFAAGVIAASTSLMADSLDMLGDAIVYGFSLYVVARSDRWKSGAAFFKAAIMAIFGLFVLAEASWKFLHPVTPVYEIIGLVGLIALAANGFCLFLLTRHRDDDVNMRSVWLCSRNDIIANVSVLVAAVGVYMTASQWPDLVIGLMIATLFLRSAWFVANDAWDTFHATSEREDARSSLL
ncbi:MAG: cation diffusion facilitator family transporter [Pseudomonadales bacterium]